MTLLGVKPDMQDYRRKRSCLSPMINCSGQVLGLGLLVPLSFYPHLLDLAEVYFLSMFDVLLLKTRVCARNVREKLAISELWSKGFGDLI